VNSRALPLVALLLLGLISGVQAASFYAGIIFQTGSGQVSFQDAVSASSASVNATWVMFSGFNSFGTLGLSPLGCSVDVESVSTSTIVFDASVYGLMGVIEVYAPSLGAPTVSGAWSSSSEGGSTFIVLLLGSHTVTLTYSEAETQISARGPDFDLYVLNISPDPAWTGSQASASVKIISLGVAGEVSIFYWVQNSEAMHLYDASLRIYTSYNGNYTINMPFKAPAAPGEYLFCFQVHSPVQSNIISRQFTVEDNPLLNVPTPAADATLIGQNTVITEVAAAILVFVYLKRKR